MGFQKSCTIIILTDGSNGHQLIVRPDTVTSWVNQMMITHLMVAEKSAQDAQWRDQHKNVQLGGPKASPADCKVVDDND